MRIGTGLSRAEFTLLAWSRATSRATDSLYLFESQLLDLHGGKRYGNPQKGNGQFCTVNSNRRPGRVRGSALSRRLNHNSLSGVCAGEWKRFQNQSRSSGSHSKGNPESTAQTESVCAGSGDAGSTVGGLQRLHEIDQRLARWLLMCQDRIGSDLLPMTHEFFAQMLGTGRPSVSLAAAVLQRAGFIQ
jgi:Crp-like helix-turn-helix domain